MNEEIPVLDYDKEMAKPEIQAGAENHKIKVMWVTDAPLSSTGYGSVGRNVLQRLGERGFEVHAVCSNYDQQKIEGFVIGGKTYNIRCYPRMNDDHAADALLYYGLRIQPDIIITLRDVGLQPGYVQPVRKLQEDMVSKGLKKPVWIGHIPIDTHYTPPDWAAIFKEMDVVLAMSEHGKNIIKQNYGLDIPFIPHGVDTKLFRPLSPEERADLRKKRNLDTMFVVGACGRNQLRKMWNKAVRAFSEFSKDKLDAKFFFHSDIHATFISDGWSFQAIGEKYGSINKLTGVCKLDPSFVDMNILKRRDVDDSEMNKYYNMLDTYFFLTGGEGFGIPTLEACAAGLPLIVTNNTTGPELAAGHGILVPIDKDQYGDNISWEGQNGVEFTVPDWRKAAEALKTLYDDEKLRKEYSIKAVEHAKKYDYDTVIIDKWVELITSAHQKRL